MTTRAQLAELDAVIAELKAHPEKHDQRMWMGYAGTAPPVVTPALDCGSAFCIAGALVVRAGAQPDWYLATIWDDDGNETRAWRASNVTTVDGTERSIQGYAADLLGLGWESGDNLFSAYNTMEDIERIRDQIAATVTDEEGQE